MFGSTLGLALTVLIWCLDARDGDPDLEPEPAEDGDSDFSREGWL